MKYLFKILNFIDWATEEYGDTLALIMITVGGILAVVGIGPRTGSLNSEGYSYIYLLHPVSLKIGLLAIIFGFAYQLSDNLITVHKISQKATYWIIGLILILLVILTLGS